MKEELGRTAYAAYCLSRINRVQLPPFDGLQEDVRQAWMAAADAVWDEVTEG